LIPFCIQKKQKSVWKHLGPALSLSACKLTAVPWYFPFKRTSIFLAASHALAKAAAGLRAKALKEGPEWDVNECSARSIRGLEWSEKNWIRYLAVSSKLMHNHMVQLSLEGRGHSGS